MSNVADFLIRIKNSSLAQRSTVLVPFTKFNLSLAKLLEGEKIIDKAEILEEKGQKMIALGLNKTGKKVPLVEVKMISKPGKRVYCKVTDLKKIRGIWTVILSTPKGLLTGREAIKANLGGEAICKIS